MARDALKISKNLDDNSITNRIDVNISDGVESLLINADGSINAVVTATDLDIRDLSHTQDSVRIGDGTELAEVTAAGELNVIATAQPGVDIGDVTINNAAGASAVNIQDGGNSITVDASQLDIDDLNSTDDEVGIGDGTNSLVVNADGSINVVVQASTGTAIVDYDEAAALASAASDNHDYTAAGGTFEPHSVEVSGESLGTFEILANAVVKGKLRTSVENPNARFDFEPGFTIADTQVLRVVRTNDSNKAHDFNSTIRGIQN